MLVTREPIQTVKAHGPPLEVKISKFGRSDVVKIPLGGVGAILRVGFNHMRVGLDAWTNDLGYGAVMGLGGRIPL